MSGTIDLLSNRRRIYQLSHATPPYDSYDLVLDREDCCCAVNVQVSELVSFTLGKIKREQTAGLTGNTWTLAELPTLVLTIFRNGVACYEGNDYEIDGQDIVFVLDLLPSDNMLAVYIVA